MENPTADFLNPSPPPFYSDSGVGTAAAPAYPSAPAPIYGPGYNSVYYPPAPPPPGTVYAVPKPMPKKISYAPVVVYLILVVIWFFLTLFAPNTGSSKALTIFSGLFWALLWAALIWLLCRKGYTGWAWFLALFSLIAWGIVLVLIFIGALVFSI